MDTFFLSLSRQTHVLAKAHAELDAIVGCDRLPTLDDRHNLPYIEAILTETLRFGPPVPSGFPRMVSNDDVYQGYFIEKGTTVMPNIWLVTLELILVLLK
jgi:cytochrome P450